MYHHDLDTHNGEPQEYRARILTREKSVIPLSLTEGLYIEGLWLKDSGYSAKERYDSIRGAIMRQDEMLKKVRVPGHSQRVTGQIRPSEVGERHG